MSIIQLPNICVIQVRLHVFFLHVRIYYYIYISEIFPPVYELDKEYIFQPLLEVHVSLNV